MILTGLEKFGFVLLFYTPDEFYIKLVSLNESIKLSKIKRKDKVPSKNEISSTSKFLIEHNSEYVLCEILDDLKFDEIFCQVLLCNSNIKLKVDYRKLLYLNSDDIVNDETCISLKFHDFSPIQKTWSCDIISKLRKLMLFKKFVFNFKSFGVDPFDGRLPVDVLNFQDRKCLNDQFIDENLALRSSEYFKEKMENEVTQIFYSKINQNVRYKVSVPLAKVSPRLRPKSNQVKPLNVSAQPFIPLRESIDSLQSKEDSTAPIIDSGPIGLQSNIVNMFSQMYRNRQEKINKSSTVPFNDYQTIFPCYGGVNFSKESRFSQQNQLKINISNQISLKSDCQPIVSEISTNSPMNSEAPSFVMPSNKTLNDQSNCFPENSSFQQVSQNDFPQDFEISESLNPVYYESPNHEEERSDNNTPISSRESIQPLCNSVQSSPVKNDENNVSNYQITVLDSQRNSPAVNTDLVLSKLCNMSISQPSSNFPVDSKPIYSSFPLSTPVNSYPTVWHPSMVPGNMNHSFGNVIFQAPMMPPFEYMKRFPVPTNFQTFTPMTTFSPIHQDNLRKFHPSFRPELGNLVNNNNLFKCFPMKETMKDDENHQIIIAEKPTENTSMPEGMWFQAPPQFVPPSPQSGRLHVQPINLIYYQPDR